ncbi:MAG: IPT/TIG domain-containing protein [Cytophagales bacterium]|nr:IPT/TIG domain-containing protein [Cytophagales bacterium]
MMRSAHRLVLLILPILFFSCTEENIPKEPTFTSFHPKEAAVGSPISLMGTGFGTDTSYVKVFFHKIPAQIQSLSDEKIEVKVPEEASTGPISIDVGNLNLLSSEDFLVLASPKPDEKEEEDKQTLEEGEEEKESEEEKEEESEEEEEELSEEDEEEEENLTDKERFVRDYFANYAVDSSPENWTGDVNSCNPGDISPVSRSEALARLNYFRRQTGIKIPLRLNTELSTKCQKAALIVAANGWLPNAHFPRSSATCYTKDGADASIGNLYLSSGPRNAFLAYTINRFIEDPGRGNEEVAHRAWFLHPKLREIGVGYTNISGAVWWNLHDSYPEGVPKFISWPPQGYVVDELVYPRWSFHYLSRNQRDRIEDAKVGVLKKTTREEIPVQVIARYSYGKEGLLSIVWTLGENVKPMDEEDATLSVTVSNIQVEGETTSISYEVIIVKKTSLVSTPSARFQRQNPGLDLLR